jgi:hypothetical protein
LNKIKEVIAEDNSQSESIVTAIFKAD